MSQALSIRSRPATFSIVDDAHGEAYAPEPASLRSRILAPSSCESCGIRTPPGESLCEKCASDRKLATADLGSISVDGLESSPVSGGRRPLFAPGQAFGPRYTIIEQVGSGGMGTVYKARDSETGRTVALKLIRPDVISRVGALSRFKRELSLAQTVSHPNVYRVHDLGNVDGNAYISMEYIEGQSLDDLIHSMGHLSPRQTVAIGRQICGGLHAIHGKAIVHRDLKPSNIMVDHAGVARLMDFGLAYQTGSEHLTSEGQVLGTMAYLSPEQARGEQVGPPSDVFALGLILYEMLTGKRPPGDGKPIPLALRGLVEPCPKPSHFVPEIPKVIDSVVMKCLERDPARRFPSAEALGSALEAVAAGQTTRIALGNLRRHSGPYDVPRGRRWPWVMAAVAALLGLLAFPAVRSRALTVIRGGSPATIAGAQVVAVLPLANIGGGDEAEDLGVGIAELLATDLADAGCGTVLPRSAVSDPKASRQDIAGTAKNLGATRIVSGTIDRSVSPMRVELSVYGPSGDFVAGFNDYERRGTFELERALSDRLLAAICLGSRSAAPGTRRLVTKPDAFLEYSRGLRLLDNPDRGGVENAIESFKRAVASDPKFGLAYAALAQAYLVSYQGNRDPFLATQASTAAMQAITLDPERPRVAVAVAQVLTGLGQHDLALDRLRKVLERAPQDDTAYAAMGDAFMAKADWPAAEEAFKKAVELRPADWSNYSGLGIVQYRLGRWRDALATYRKISELQPGDVLGYIMLGANHYALGDSVEALRQFEKANAIAATPTATGEIALILMEQGRPADALRAFERAAEMAPKQSVRQLHLGNALEHASRPKDARAAWTRGVALAEAALRVNDNDVVALRSLAVCRAQLGDYEAAQRNIASALAIAPRDGDVLAASAQVALLAHNEPDAIHDMGRALENGYSPAAARKDFILGRLRTRPEFVRLTGATPLT